MATIRGSKGRNTLTGTTVADLMYGGNGNDVLSGAAGNDVLWGGTGDDRLSGGSGNDKLYGEDGNDLLTGGLGADLLNGGVGFDTVSYAGATAGVAVNLTSRTASGGEASGDTLVAIEAVIGTSRGDILTGSAVGNLLGGLDGADSLSGLAGNDYLDGGAGGDVISGGDDDDLLIGGAGNDTLLGDAGNDTLRPGTGLDAIDGGAGVNTLDYSDALGGIFLLLESGTTGGAAFGDTFINIQNLIGSAHNDVITARSSGAGGIIDGGAGDDTLMAGMADGERLIGGYGNDQLIAAANSADEIELQRDRGADYILSFDASNGVPDLRDTLLVSGDAFGFGSALDPSELVSVLDGMGPQFLQQAVGGDLMLYFDADGEAGLYGLALVARLSGLSSLTVDSFRII